MSAKPKPTPHNPDNVTPAQLNPRKGGKRWRLLDSDEVYRRKEIHKEIERWAGDTRWDDTHWCGDSVDCTYRTRLTRAELAKLK